MWQPKNGDIVVYEPLPQFKEAQELYGAVGVVIDATEQEGYYAQTIYVEWLCRIDSKGLGKWRVTTCLCRKIGHVELAEDIDATV